MAKVKIIEIPGKFISYWDDSSFCVIDTWLDFYSVSITDVEKVLLGTVIPFIKNKKCEVHVVDNSLSSGAFSREVTEYFRTEVASRMKETNLKYFVTVFSENSPIANISMRSVMTDDVQKKFFIIEASSVKEGLHIVDSLKRGEKTA